MKRPAADVLAGKREMYTSVSTSEGSADPPPKKSYFSSMFNTKKAPRGSLVTTEKAAFEKAKQKGEKVIKDPESGKTLVLNPETGDHESPGACT